MGRTKLGERDLAAFKTRTKKALRTRDRTGQSVEQALELSSGSLSRLYSGRRRLTFELVCGIAEQVGVEPLDLLTDGAREHFADEISASVEAPDAAEAVAEEAPEPSPSTPEPSPSTPEPTAGGFTGSTVPPTDRWSEPRFDEAPREERRRKRDIPARVVRRLLTVLRDIVGL